MVKVAAMKKTDSDEVQKAKLAFLISVADLSWRLAAIFMIPVLIGYGIDRTTGSESGALYGTLAGFVLSVLFIIRLGLEATKK